MRRIRRRYLLVRYDPSSMTLASARSLLLGLAREGSEGHSPFKHNAFALDSGLIVLSAPHVRVNDMKRKISAAGAGLRVVLVSGTVKGLKRKVGKMSSRKGLSEPGRAEL